ncbi:MAG: hypothetical protein MUE46_00745 [Xanthomonadales bacterium]|jgi:hypothetical protein|nr:hypothetical protein [Xanthomonadales bacterium]
MRAVPPREDNPWAPPAARELEFLAEGGVWREGEEIVLLRQAALPARCVCCNATVSGPIAKRQLYWHHPGWYLLIPLNLFVYALVAIFVRESAQIAPGRCRTHQWRHLAIRTGGCLVIALVLWLTFTRLVHQPVTLLVGLGLMLAAMILTIVSSRDVYPVRIDHRCIRLKGAGRAFLDSLPEGSALR